MLKSQTKDKQLIDELRQKVEELSEENRHLKQTIKCEEEVKKSTAIIHQRAIDIMAASQFRYAEKEETT